MVWCSMVWRSTVHMTCGKVWNGVLFYHKSKVRQSKDTSEGNSHIVIFLLYYILLQWYGTVRYHIYK